MLPTNRPPTHPGEMLLKEFLEPLNITQKDFSNHLGWTYARLNEIMRNHIIPINTEIIKNREIREEHEARLTKIEILVNNINKDK